MRAWFKFVDATVVIGTVISIGISLTLVLLGQDKAISLLIGLTITIITLLIDIITRIRETEQKILTTTSLTKALLDDPLLHPILNQMVNDYIKVKHLSFDFFIAHSQKTLLECRDIIHELSEGRMTDEAKYSNIRYGGKAQKSVKMVVCNIEGFWRTKYGQTVMEKNQIAIARGVKFTHIWIQPKEVLIEYQDILRQLQKLGMSVNVATPNDVPKDLIEPYRIVDDKKLIRLELGFDGQSRTQKIFIEPVTVLKMAQKFNLLLQYTQNLDDYFGNK